jgi:hypothetical protein
MRFGNGLGTAAVGVVLASISAHLATRADEPRRLKAVPLGGSLTVLSEDRHFGVYIPTQFGGELTIETTEGKVGPITGPDGRECSNGHDVGTNAHGWYTFTVSGAERHYTVSATFIQVGESERKPWNFYYWPTKADAIHEPWAGGNGRVDTMQVFGDDILVAMPGGYIPPGQDIVRAGPNGLLETPVAPGDDSTWFPNLYDDLTFRGADGTMYQTPSPLLKYDQIFNTSARSWEAANSQNQDISRWPGHCLGGAVASILLNEPTPAPGSGLTRDELKALWAELGESHHNHRIGDSVVDIPPGPPRPGPDECDWFAARFHQMLETHIRGRKQALLGNLRGFPPRGTADEVWNHGIGMYTARYKAIPGMNAHMVLVEVELVANSGSSLDGRDEKPRSIRYVYTLVYGLDGRVDETRANACDWIGVGGEALFAPLNLMEVVGTRWAGHNPQVTEVNVRALDLANGGAPPRLAGTPPQLQPVGEYEAGFVRRIFSGRSGGTPAPPRRVGLFRFFGIGRR